MRTHVLSPLAALMAAALLSGCGGASSTPNSTSLPATPMRIDFNQNGFVLPDATKVIGVRLSSEKQVKNKIYGNILGYFNGTTSKTTQIVNIKLGSKVVFHNVDTSHPHTGSLLGDATKNNAPWPKSFDGSGSQSPAGTDISTSSFSTGAMNPGTNSLVYDANTAGYYMFGCFYHYNTNQMRDILIVK